MDFDIDKNGHLVISIDPEEASDIRELYEERGENAAFFEVFEPVLTNGLHFVQPEEIGALTSAPILSDSAPEDDGRYPDDASFWWYPDYQIKNSIEELLNEGQVTFAAAGQHQSKALIETSLPAKGNEIGVKKG